MQVIPGDHAASSAASSSSGLRRPDPSSSGPLLVFLYPHTKRIRPYTLLHHHTRFRVSLIPAIPTHHLPLARTIPISLEDGHHASIGPGIHRPSLSAMGGDGGLPQLPLFRALSPKQPTLEADDELGVSPNLSLADSTLMQADRL